MAQLNYAPTKTNLLRLKSDLQFAQQGYELLDQKILNFLRENADIKVA